MLVKNDNVILNTYFGNAQPANTTTINLDDDSDN